MREKILRDKEKRRKEAIESEKRQKELEEVSIHKSFERRKLNNFFLLLLAKEKGARSKFEMYANCGYRQKNNFS